MSGAYAVSTKKEYDYELRENKEQRQRRARTLRVVYAMCDDGWDRRRLPRAKRELLERALRRPPQRPLVPSLGALAG